IVRELVFLVIFFLAAIAFGVLVFFKGLSVFLGAVFLATFLSETVDDCIFFSVGKATVFDYCENNETMCKIHTPSLFAQSLHRKFSYTLLL
ncbi:hypothetical protein ACO1NC_13610, partial [Staphylococcus aureus]